MVKRFTCPVGFCWDIREDGLDHFQREQLQACPVLGHVGVLVIERPI